MSLRINTNQLPDYPSLPETFNKQFARLSEIVERDVEWLWEPRIPLGMVSILTGNPGVGKTGIAKRIAADVTQGMVPFSGEDGIIGNVLYLSYENSAEYVIKKSFCEMGGDPDRFMVLKYEEGSKEFELRDLTDTLTQLPNIRLVIFDPLQSFLVKTRQGGDLDINRSNHTRPQMDYLTALAEKHNTAMLLLRHGAKAVSSRAIFKGLGSIDLTAAARSELLAGNLPDEPDRRAMVHIKSNIGPIAPALDYEIDRDGKFSWTGISEVTAGEINAPEDPDAASKMETAIDVLKEKLAAGSYTLKDGKTYAAADDVTKAATAAGVSLSTLKRAKRKLDVKSKQEADHWYWRLP